MEYGPEANNRMGNTVRNDKSVRLIMNINDKQIFHNIKVTVHLYFWEAVGPWSQTPWNSPKIVFIKKNLHLCYTKSFIFRMDTPFNTVSNVYLFKIDEWGLDACVEYNICANTCNIHQ